MTWQDIKSKNDPWAWRRYISMNGQWRFGTDGKPVTRVFGSYMSRGPDYYSCYINIWWVGFPWLLKIYVSQQRWRFPDPHKDIS